MLGLKYLTNFQYENGDSALYERYLMNQTHSIYQLKVRFHNFINFTYLIIDEKTKQAAIIDPAWELPKVESVLQRLNVSLAIILLTHSHFDHVNLVGLLLNRYHPQVFMSLNEINFYKFKCKNLNPLDHHDIIKLGETEILCLLTPGHTIGSTCYLLSDSLFTGDTIFIEGCGICDTTGGSPEKMFLSIQEIRANVDPHVKIFPGHSYGKKPGYPLNYLLKENIYFQIESIEQFIAFRMRQNQKGLFNFK
jgi:hydroxyacylglutathione hydrolase